MDAMAGCRDRQPRPHISGTGSSAGEIYQEEINMYTAKVMDHFQHPRNVGEIENPSGMGTVGNPKCGDIMRI